MWSVRRRQPRVSEATVARRKAEENLRATIAETPRYKALGDALRDLRERNNFAAAIEASFRHGRSSR